MKYIFNRVSLFWLLVVGSLSIGFGQNDCPAYPAQSVWDTNCFIKTGTPDPSATDRSADKLYLPEATFNGKYGQSAHKSHIPNNRKHWALGIAHAWNFARNINKSEKHPKISYWMATPLQESEFRCDQNADWGGGNVGSPVGTAWSNIWEDGCYQIEGVNDGSAYGALIQYYPLRFRAGEHPNLIGGDNFVTSAIVKSYYDAFTERIAEYRWGWDYTNTVNTTCDPFAFEKLSASSYNGGIYAFQGAASFMGSNSCYWSGLPATTAGYATQIGDEMAVLEGGWFSFNSYVTTFTASGSSFDGYYNESIAWSDVEQYLDDIDDLYWEVNFSTDVTPLAQAAFIQISGGIATPINFQDIGPVIDAVILALPKEDAMAPALLVDGAPGGTNGVNCDGDVVPASHIQPNGETTFCNGLSLDLEAIVDGGGGKSPTYEWRVGSPTGAILSTDKVYTISPAIGNYTYYLTVCNDKGCFLSCCPLDVVVEDCGFCGLTANITQTNTPCKGMPAGSFEVEIDVNPNSSSSFEVKYTGTTSNGTVSGSVMMTGTSVTINDLIDGDYNFEIIDQTDTDCKAYTNKTLDFTTDVNEYVEATLIGQSSSPTCIAEMQAELIELPQPCQFRVQVVPAAAGTSPPNVQANPIGWEAWVSATVQTSSGGAQNFSNAIDRSMPATAYFTANTGDEFTFFTQLTATPGASQQSGYYYQLYDEASAEVFATFSPAGSASATVPYNAGSFTVTCPYDPPAYDFSWEPAITEVNVTDVLYEGKGPVLEATNQWFTVTATNRNNTTCFTKDSVEVLLDASCGVSCYPPGTVELKKSNEVLTGNVEVCKQLITDGYEVSVVTSGVGIFSYELFKDGQTQGIFDNNLLTLVGEGDYYVKVIDKNNPTDQSCHETSNTITIVDQGPDITEYCLGTGPVELSFMDGNEWIWKESDGTLIGNQAANGSVTWSAAPTTAGNYQIILEPQGESVLGDLIDKPMDWESVPSGVDIVVTKAVYLNTVEVYIIGTDLVNLIVSVTGDLTKDIGINDIQANNAKVELDLGGVLLLPGNYNIALTGALPRLRISNPAAVSDEFPGKVSVSSSTSPFVNINFSDVGTITEFGCYPLTIDLEAKVCCTQNAPTISVTKGNESACTGDDLELTAVSSGATKFQWYKDGTAISGATNATLTVTTTNTAASASYTATVTESSTCVAESDPSTGIDIEINKTPTFTITQPSDQCEGNYDLLTAVQSLTPSDATVSYWDSETNGSSISKTVTASGDYWLEAEKDGCSSVGREKASIQIDQNPVITLPTALEVCSPLSVDITSTATQSAVLTYHVGSGGTGSTQSTSVSTSGDYSVKAVNGACEVTEDLTVTINSAPSISITTGTSEICDDGSEDATIPLTIVDGASDYTVYFTDASNTKTNQLYTTKTGISYATSLVGVYTIDSIVDGNGCQGSGTGSYTVSHRSNIDTSNYSVTCDNNDDVVVSFDIVDGVTSDHEVKVNSGTAISGSSFTSSPLAENTDHTFVVGDGTTCNPITLSVRKSCSCPSIATLSLDDTDNKVCPEDGTDEVQLKIEFTNGTGPYDFTIKDQTAVTGHTSSSYTTSVPVGTYDLTQFIDQGAGCEGSRTGSVTVESHTKPTVSFSSVNDTLLCDNGSDQVELTITASSGVTAVTYNDGTSDLALNTSPFTFTSTQDDTYTITSVEVDGCTHTGFTSSTSVDYHDSYDTSNFQIVCDVNNDAATNTYNYVVSFDVSGDLSPSEITVTGASGSFSGTTWTSDLIDEATASFTLSIVDDVTNCKPLSISGIEKTCSRPTVSFVEDIVTVCKGIEGKLQLQTSGSGTVEVSYSQDDVPQTDLTSSPYEITSTTPTVIKLTNIKDDKFDDVISPVLVGEIRNHADLTATHTLVCDANNDAATTTWNYRVQIEVTEGNGDYEIEGDITDSFTGTTWESGLIDENVPTSITLKDGSDCKTITLSDLSKTCSCPSAATVSAVGTDKLCSSDSVELALTFTGTDDYAYTLTNGIETSTGTSTGTSSVYVQSEGIYTITFTDNGDAGCVDVTGGNITVGTHDLPTAAFSSTSETICEQNGLTTFALTTSSGVTSVTYNDGASDVLLSSPFEFDVTSANTFTLVSVSNINCTEAITSSSTSSATVDYHPNFDTTSVELICDDANNNALTNTWNYQIKVTTSGGELPFTIKGDGIDEVETSNVWTSGLLSESETKTITLEDVNGCSPIVISNLNQRCSCTSRASMSITSSNQQVCTDGNSAVEIGLAFIGTGDFDYTLNRNGSVYQQDVVSSTTASVLVDKSGVYTLSFIDNGLSDPCGSPVSTEVTVTNYDEPSLELTESIDSICANGVDLATLEVALVSGLNPFKYTYTDGVSQLEKPVAGLTDLIKTNIGGTYELLSVEDARGCTSVNVSGVAEVVLVSEPNPELSVSDFAICELSDTLITVIPSANTSNDQLAWYRNGIPLFGETSSTLLVSSGGNYQVEQYNVACEDYFSESVEVDVISLPVVSAGSDLRKEDGDRFTISEATVIGDYTGVEWTEVTGNTGLFQTSITELNPELLSDVGEALEYTYILQVNNEGCLVTDSVEVSIFIPLNIYNTFSPNGDGINDSWTIQGLERYEEVKMKIYDRWGQKVYEDNDSNAWLGTLNGKTVPVGTYYYIVELKDPIEEDEIRTGYITVVK